MKNNTFLIKLILIFLTISGVAALIEITFNQNDNKTKHSLKNEIESYYPSHHDAKY